MGQGSGVPAFGEEDGIRGELSNARAMGSFFAALAEGPVLVAEVTGEDGDRHAHGVGDFAGESRDAKRGQDLVGEEHADRPGLSNRRQINQNEEKDRAAEGLFTLSEDEELGENKGGDHAHDVGQDDRHGESHPNVKDDA
jgi:hypothetical protein